MANLGRTYIFTLIILYYSVNVCCDVLLKISNTFHFVSVAVFVSFFHLGSSNSGRLVKTRRHILSKQFTNVFVVVVATHDCLSLGLM